MCDPALALAIEGKENADARALAAKNISDLKDKIAQMAGNFSVDPKLFVAKPVEKKEVGEKEVNEIPYLIKMKIKSPKKKHKWYLNM